MPVTCSRGRRAEGARANDADATAVIVFVEPLNCLVDVAVQADLEAVDGQQLHELVVHHLLAGDGMMPDRDLEPAVVGALLQAIQGTRQRRHMDACPVAVVVVDLPAGVEPQEQDAILGSLDKERLVCVVRRVLLPGVDAAVEVRVEVGKPLAVQPVVAAAARPCRRPG